MKDKTMKHVTNNSGAGAVYGMGMIGVLFYYFSHAHTFMDFLWGVIKALIWPALLTFKAFEFLKL